MPLAAVPDGCRNFPDFTFRIPYHETAAADLASGGADLTSRIATGAESLPGDDWASAIAGLATAISAPARTTPTTFLVGLMRMLSLLAVGALGVTERTQSASTTS